MENGDTYKYQEMTVGGREIDCTKEAPWNTLFANYRVRHVDAVYVDDKDYGDGEVTAVYKCPNCGIVFEVELPQ